MAPKKKSSAKVSSSPSTTFGGKSRLPSASFDEDDVFEDGATLSSIQSPRAQSPDALSVISTSGSEDNESIKDFYVEDAEEDQQPPSVCKWVGCGDEFQDLQTLVDHVHEDHIGSSKSKYACDWEGCPRRGKLQNSRFSLLSHVRSHTGERPFTCPRPECDKSFTRSDAMAKHMRVQHGTAPTPLRPIPTKKSTTSGTAAAGAGDGSDGEDSANVASSGGTEQGPAQTLSSIWECDSDFNTEYPGGSQSQALRARNHATRSSQRDSDNPLIDAPPPATYPAGHGWVYEEIPPPPLTQVQLKAANQEAVDEAEFNFWSTKGSEIELLRSQVLSTQVATGAGGLPVDPSANSDGLSLEELDRKERMKRSTLNGTEGGMQEAIKFGFISALDPSPIKTESEQDQKESESDSEVDEESKESWMREDRKNAFEIGLLSESRKRWVEFERTSRPKRRAELELQYNASSVMDGESTNELDNPSSNSSTPAPAHPSSAMSPPPPPSSESSDVASKINAKKRKIGTAEASSLGLFTNVPVDHNPTSSSRISARARLQDQSSSTKSQEEDELTLMRKRYLVEKAKLKVVANERRRMETELKELKKLRKSLRDGPDGTKEMLKSCLTMELGPNVQAIFSPPNSP